MGRLQDLGVVVTPVDVEDVERAEGVHSYGARPVHLVITMIQWIRTSRLAIQNSISLALRDPVTALRKSSSKSLRWSLLLSGWRDPWKGGFQDLCIVVPPVDVEDVEGAEGVQLPGAKSIGVPRS